MLSSFICSWSEQKETEVSIIPLQCSGWFCIFTHHVSSHRWPPSSAPHLKLCLLSVLNWFTDDSWEEELMLSFAQVCWTHEGDMNILYISSTDKNKYFDLEFGDLHLMELKVHPGDTNSIQSDVSENPERSQSVESDPTNSRKTPSIPRGDTSKTALVIPVLFFRQTLSPYKIQKKTTNEQDSLINLNMTYFVCLVLQYLHPHVCTFTNWSHESVLLLWYAVAWAGADATLSDTTSAYRLSRLSTNMLVWCRKLTCRCRREEKRKEINQTYFLWKIARKQHFAGAAFASGEKLSHRSFMVSFINIILWVRFAETPVFVFSVQLIYLFVVYFSVLNN